VWTPGARLAVTGFEVGEVRVAVPKTGLGLPRTQGRMPVTRRFPARVSKADFSAF